MRFPKSPFLSTVLLLPLFTYAQTTSGTIEGVVVDYVSGNHSDTTTVEARGKKYLFCLGCPGSLKDSPQIVGDQDIRVGTRVRVTYAKLTRSRDGSELYIKALRVVNLSSPSTSKGPSTASADDTWISFWEAFRTAVRKRDRVALRRMMTEDFQFYADGASPDQAIKFFDTWDHGRDWTVLDKLVLKGTEPYRSPNPQDKGPSRIAPVGHSRNKAGRVVIFNFGNKGRWRWTFYGQIEGN